MVGLVSSYGVGVGTVARDQPVVRAGSIFGRRARWEAVLPSACMVIWRDNRGGMRRALARGSGLPPTWPTPHRSQVTPRSRCSSLRLRNHGCSVVSHVIRRAVPDRRSFYSTNRFLVL